jgi:hypothetical protein
MRYSWFLLALFAGMLWVASASGISLGEAVIATFGFGFLYVYGRTFSWVTIEDKGLLGPYRPTGPRIALSWSEPSILRAATYLGMQGVHLLSHDGTRTIFIPRDVLQTPGFKAAVARFAPQAHSLRKLHGAA